MRSGNDDARRRALWLQRGGERWDCGGERRNEGEMRQPTHYKMQYFQPTHLEKTSHQLSLVVELLLHQFYFILFL